MIMEKKEKKNRAYTQTQYVMQIRTRQHTRTRSGVGRETLGTPGVVEYKLKKKEQEIIMKESYVGACHS